MGVSPEVASFAFHEVTDRPSETGFQRPGAAPFRLSPRAFEGHLDQLAESSCTPERVTGLDLASAGRHLLLTFDDGGKSALHAADALSQRGWVGHFFVVTSRIGSRTFLDRNEIRYLHTCGHLVGSHSHTHPNIFRELKPGEMAAEWSRSARLLSDLLGSACETGSVPGGEISRKVFESAAAAGLRFLFTVEPELRPKCLNGCWILGRYLVKAGTAPSRIRRLSEFSGWSGALAFRRLKAVARRSVPPLYRYVVARRTRESLSEHP
jgi:peptidoglycan/xylan/chitin deacetylase (PgdA/CDA1 family)